MNQQEVESYIKRPRFDNVISAGTILQMLTLVVSLAVGGVSLYNSLKYQTEKQSDKIDRLSVSVEDLAASTTLSIRELDGRIRAVEMELPRQSDRIETLREDLKRLETELIAPPNYHTQ